MCPIAAKRYRQSIQPGEKWGVVRKATKPLDPDNSSPVSGTTRGQEPTEDPLGEGLNSDGVLIDDRGEPRVLFEVMNIAFGCHPTRRCARRPPASRTKAESKISTVLFVRWRIEEAHRAA